MTTLRFFLRTQRTYKAEGYKADLIEDDVTVCRVEQPVVDQLQPSLRPDPDEVPEVFTAKTLRSHGLCVTPCPLEVPVGEDCLVTEWSTPVVGDSDEGS